jgi:uncharacterized protein YukE
MIIGPDEMIALGEQLISKKSDLDAELTAQKAAVQAIEESFNTEKASGTFQQNYEEFSAGLAQMLEGMDGLGNFLKSYGQGARDFDAAFAG